MKGVLIRTQQGRNVFVIDAKRQGETDSAYLAVEINFDGQIVLVRAVSPGGVTWESVRSIPLVNIREVDWKFSVGTMAAVPMQTDVLRIGDFA